MVSVTATFPVSRRVVAATMLLALAACGGPAKVRVVGQRAVDAGERRSVPGCCVIGAGGR